MESKNYWVYIMKTPDNHYYVGYSGQKKISHRLTKRAYINTSLQSYIEKYGWDALEKIVVTDGLTKEQSLYWENRLICMYMELGCCINKQRSGNITKDINYKHFNYIENREHRIEKVKQYRVEHLNEIKGRKKKYYQDNLDYILKHRREFYQINHDRLLEKTHKPENLIYKRVNNYNRNHAQIETPLEAKQKYLASGYIPDYIKNDDLI